MKSRSPATSEPFGCCDRLWCKPGSGPNVSWAPAALSVAKWSSGKRCFPQFRYSRFPIPELACLELTLPDLLRQLYSANGDCRVAESFESKHRPNPLFDSELVLFDETVQALDRSHFYSARTVAGTLQF